MNVTAQLEFELGYFKAAVLHFSHNTMRTPYVFISLQIYRRSGDKPYHIYSVVVTFLARSDTKKAEFYILLAAFIKYNYHIIFC